MTPQRAADSTPDAVHYRHLIDQLPDVVLIITDRDMRYVLAGGKALARTGWRVADMRGRRPRDLLPGPVAEVIESHMTAALQGRSSTMPALPGCPAGAVWEARFAPLPGRGGTVDGVIFILRDLTRQHWLSERVRESEERFSSTVDALLDAFVLLSAVRDESGKIVDLRADYANSIAGALFESTPERLPGHRLLTAFPSLAPLGLFGELVHTIETGVPTDFQLPWFEEDVLAGAFEVRAAKLGDGVVVTLRDVTGRMHAEQRLRASEERYRVTVESAASGMANVGLDGRFLRVNRRFCELTGYSEQEMLSLRFQDITHPDDVGANVALARRVAGGEAGWYSTEKRYLHKNGPVVWVMLTVAALHDEEGRPAEFVITATDITAQKQAQDEVARLNTELEERVRERTAELDEANRNLEAFSYTVSHDLRAPLTALAGFTEMLADRFGGRLGVTGLEYVTRIRAAGERMDHLISDLLALSQASHAEIHDTTVDLSAAARTIAAALRHDDPDRQVQVSIADGVEARGDERLLHTVLENLLGNAWKFTARTDEAAIRFGTLPAEDGMVHCYVRDNGAGFNPADASRLFQPFSRLHSDGEFPGTGVGLASVHRIVTRHHGRCWAEGQPGQGAVFHFTLPAGPGPAPAA